MNIPILLISNFLSSSGGSRGVCEELALRLSENGAPIVAASEKLSRIPRLLDMISTAISQRQKYSVAHVDVFSGPAFFWAEATCATLRWLKKPYILTLHGGNLPEFARRHPNRVRKLLASAQITTAPSHYLREQMAPYRKDLRLLLNALDTVSCAFRPRNRARPSLVWLRSFHEIYNPSLAPKVLRLLVDKFPDIQLTMVGPDKKDGSLQRLQQVAAELGVTDRICFPGAVIKQDVPGWMNRSDIFLNTTNVDNAPVSVLEAMACGLCVVSTNVGGLPYLLKDKHDALLVPPDDAEAMAKAVERLLTDSTLASNLSRNGRAKAEEHDWSRVLPQWEELFAAVAIRTT